MITSENIDALAAALAAAQGEFQTPRKSNTVTVRTDAGATYSYSYADLAEILDLVRPVLAKHGLSLLQPVSTENGHIVVKTRILHSSGQWLEESLAMAVVQTGKMNQIQAAGSVISYLRRYSVSALLSIAADQDNDANLSSHEVSKKASKAPAPQEEVPPGQLKVREVVYLQAIQLIERIQKCRNVYELNGVAKKYRADYDHMSEKDQASVRAAKELRKAELNSKKEEENAVHDVEESGVSGELPEQGRGENQVA